MTSDIIIKGRLTGPTSVELDESVMNATGDVDVIVHRRTATDPADCKTVFEFLRHLRPPGLDRDQIDRQLRQEREAWERET